MNVGTSSNNLCTFFNLKKFRLCYTDQCDSRPRRLCLSKTESHSLPLLLNEQPFVVYLVPFYSFPTQASGLQIQASRNARKRRHSSHHRRPHGNGLALMGSKLLVVDTSEKVGGRLESQARSPGHDRKSRNSNCSTQSTPP